MKKYIPLALVILLNLYPIIGIIFLGWDVNFTLFSYLAETLVLVVFSTIKMLMSRKMFDEESAKLNPHLVNQSRKYILFNLLMMMYVFVIVLYTLYLMPWQSGTPFFTLSMIGTQYKSIVSLLASSVLSHAVSFFVYYIGGGERNTIALSSIFNRVMIGRVLPLFFSPFIIFFLLPIIITSSTFMKIPLLVIFGLVGLFDILAHTKQHANVVNLNGA